MCQQSWILLFLSQNKNIFVGTYSTAKNEESKNVNVSTRLSSIKIIAVEDGANVELIGIEFSLIAKNIDPSVIKVKDSISKEGKINKRIKILFLLWK